MEALPLVSHFLTKALIPLIDLFAQALALVAKFCSQKG